MGIGRKDGRKHGSEGSKGSKGKEGRKEGRTRLRAAQGAAELRRVLLQVAMPESSLLRNILGGVPVHATH